MENIVKSLAKKLKSYRYHQGHKTRAEQVVSSIEAQRGKLSPHIKNLCDQYASDALGWKGYSPWLYVYSLISGEFREGWIPDNYYGAKVLPRMKGEYGKLASLNALGSVIFKNKAIPDLAHVINGLVIDPETRGVMNESEFYDACLSKNQKIVYKLDSSSQGRNVYFFDSKPGIYEMLKGLGNGVVQPYIKQHDFFNEYTPSSVATIRLTTVIDGYGSVSLRAGYLRLGQGEDTHVKSSTHVRVPISIDDGKLYDVGYLPNWHYISSHPDCKKEFSGKAVPSYRSCVDTAKSMHSQYPYARVIGWDLVVNQLGEVEVMEWNGGHNDIKFSEAVQGPCFKDLKWDSLRADDYKL
jgi:hypothetical protein